MINVQDREETRGQKKREIERECGIATWIVTPLLNHATY
jgi:hypothetical protein